MSFWLPLLVCIVTGVISELLSHEFPTTNNYAECGNSLWGTRIPILRKRLRLDNFVSRLLEVRQSEYKRLIVENIIRIAQRKRRQMRKMRQDKTQKSNATDKDNEIKQKLGTLTGKRNMLQKTTNDDFILKKFNEWNKYKPNIKLLPRHLATVRNDHALPLYRGMFHKLLNAFLDEMIATEQQLINNLGNNNQK